MRGALLLSAKVARLLGITWWQSQRLTAGMRSACVLMGVDDLMMQISKSLLAGGVAGAVYVCVCVF